MQNIWKKMSKPSGHFQNGLNSNIRQYFSSYFSSYHLSNKPTNFFSICEL